MSNLSGVEISALIFAGVAAVAATFQSWSADRSYNYNVQSRQSGLQVEACIDLATNLNKYAEEIGKYLKVAYRNELTRDSFLKFESALQEAAYGVERSIFSHRIKAPVTNTERFTELDGLVVAGFDTVTSENPSPEHLKKVSFYADEIFKTVDSLVVECRAISNTGSS